MIGLALTACFICPLGVFLSIAFLILGKRVKKIPLRLFLWLVCVITLFVNVYNCIQTIKMFTGEL